MRENTGSNVVVIESIDLGHGTNVNACRFLIFPPLLRKRDQGSLYILIERSRHRRANRPNTQEKEESKLTNTKKQTRETTRETKLTNTREAEERKTTRETKLTGKEERQENRGTKDKVHSYKWRNEKKWPCRSVRCSLTKEVNILGHFMVFYPTKSKGVIFSLPLSSSGRRNPKTWAERIDADSMNS